MRVKEVRKDWNFRPGDGNSEFVPFCHVKSPGQQLKVLDGI